VLQRIGDRHFVDLVAVLVHDGDEPAVPFPDRHLGAPAKAIDERYSVRARSGVAAEVDALVIAEDVFAVGEMEIVARHRGFSRAMIFDRTPSTAATGRHGAGRTSKSLRRRYIGGLRQQPKGGDPVSHCLSPRSPA